MNPTALLNRICRAMYRAEYRRFQRPCDIRTIQTGHLMQLLRNNPETVYGRKCGFAEIRSYKDFAANVPLTVYEDYAPYIEQIAAGKQHILTAEPVLLFEPTSGSSGGRKLIPYTQSLKAEFQRGIRPWICDLYTKIPGLTAGKSYWSITPVTAGKEYSTGGISIGFEDDAAYFGRLEQRLMRRIFAVDGSVKHASDIQVFYRETGRQLLHCGRLSMISVWNPTFLTILCDAIRADADLLTDDLPAERKQTVRQALKKNRFDLVFPGLRLISCWADGSAADDIAPLQARFPGIMIQPKGLLSTECFAAFPLVGNEGSYLSIYSHFFEFRDLQSGEICTADQVREQEYELIVTTGGGFYRYCTGDIVRILHTEPNRPPRLKFLRRSGIASDLCGEKLTDAFVRNVCQALGIAADFCLLAPEGKHYILYTTTAAGIGDDTLDQALCESYHYAYCRKLGQLGKAEIRHVAADADRLYLEHLTEQGMRLGDIKPAFLSKRSGWDAVFRSRDDS